MQVIKISKEFAAQLETATWVIINEDYAVGAYKSRQAAREAKAEQGLVGKILNKSEVEFVVATFEQALIEGAREIDSFIAEQKAADAKANQAEFVGEDGEAEKVGKIEVTHESTIKRPCKQVWHIADSMPGAKRKEVIAACVAQGIAYYTARTQYQQWLQTVKSQTATQASSK